MKRVYTVQEVMEELNLSRAGLQYRELRAGVKPKQQSMGQTKIKVNVYSEAQVEAMRVLDPGRDKKKVKK